MHPRKYTHLGVCIHTEGISDIATYHSLKNLGKKTIKVFRPTLLLITPKSPMYQINPRTMRKLSRRKFPTAPTNALYEDTRIEDFTNKIDRLSSYFDIGYHGHFLKEKNGSFVPSFDEKLIEKQFDLEYRFLSSSGFRPKIYGGGWWYFSQQIANLLAYYGFSIDTTLTDVGVNDFGHRQAFRDKMVVGECVKISPQILEIPSLLRWRTIIKLLQNQPSFGILVIHDYDLIRFPLLAEILIRLFGKTRCHSVPEIADIAANQGLK